MKRIAITLILVLGAFSQALHAFDPVGPPASSSLSRTISHASRVRLPRVDCPETPLDEVLEFIRVPEIPKKFGVIIDASRMKLPESTRVNIVAKDITILEAAALVAEQLHADLLIKPGKILLVPQSEKPSK
jgi:hypothetical protein